MSPGRHGAPTWAPPLLLLELLCLRRAGAADAQDAASVCDASGGGDGCAGHKGKDEGPAYYYSRRCQGLRCANAVPWSGPADLTKPAAWAWPNADDEQVRHSPLIDDQKNIYVTTTGRIYKLSPDGMQLWKYQIPFEEGRTSVSPTLYKGSIYAMAIVQAPAPTMIHFALSMATGELMWKAKRAGYSNLDAHSLMAYNDTLVYANRDHLEPRPLVGGEDGNNMVSAVRTSNGDHLWDYVADDIFWNFAASSPGDGTIIFASQCGGVFRVDWSGRLIYRTGKPNPGRWCGCGGGTLASNGMFYSEFNDYVGISGHPRGGVAAYQLSDGKLLWERSFSTELGGWQYPAVGRLRPDGPHVVVAPLGMITGPPMFPPWEWMDKISPSIRIKLYHMSIHWAWLRNIIRKDIKPLRNVIVALHGDTGQELWRFEEEPWDHFGAISDEDNFVGRVVRSWNEQQRDAMCLPDPWGIPLLAEDGTVYASSSHTGKLYAIRNENGDAQIDPSEVTVFPTGHTFLNGPSMAPGMLVAAPCWGPVHVWKS